MPKQRIYINQLAICYNCELQSLDLNPLAIIPSAVNTVREILNCPRHDNHLHWCDYCGIILNPKIEKKEKEIVV